MPHLMGAPGPIRSAQRSKEKAREVAGLRTMPIRGQGGLVWAYDSLPVVIITVHTSQNQISRTESYPAPGRSAANHRT